MYSTRTRVHMRIPNGHPHEEKRAYRKKKSANKLARIVVRVRLVASPRAERAVRAMAG